MSEHTKRYQRLSREAKRLMRAGDLNTYMSKLREMYSLRMIMISLRTPAL